MIAIAVNSLLLDAMRNHVVAVIGTFPVDVRKAALMMLGAFVCCNGVSGGAIDDLRNPMVIYGLNLAVAGMHDSLELRGW